MHIGAMLLASLLMAAIGAQVARRPAERIAGLGLGVLALSIALSEGYYWNLFGRGSGFFTANRGSALLVFTALLLGPWGIRKLIANK